MQILTVNLTLFNLFSSISEHIEDRTMRIKDTLVLLMALTGKRSLNILLADDDEEDREIFAYAIRELSPDIKMHIAVNGKDLMNILNDEDRPLPDILFLD